MLFDLHVHSKDSSCSKLTMKQIIMSAKLKDLDAVCIVNHDKISEIHLKSRILILIGCEVTTKDGHLLIFGLNEEITKDLPVEEALELIHEQGAIAIGAHPFRNIEYVENSATEKSISSKPVIGGSDAHFQEEIGKIKMESKIFIEDINDLIEAIKKNGFRFIF